MKLDKKQQIRIAKIVGLIVIVYIYYNYLCLPKKKQAAALQFQLQEIETEIQKARTNANYLEEMQKEIAVIEQRWNYMKKRIPSKKQFPQILEELAEAATGDNVYYVSIAPEITRRYSAIMIKNLNYEKLPIKINLQCRYRDLGNYLYKLDNLYRLIKVEDIELKADESAFPLLSVDLIVSTYVVSER